LDGFAAKFSVCFTEKLPAEPDTTTTAQRVTLEGAPVVGIVHLNAMLGFALAEKVLVCATAPVDAHPVLMAFEYVDVTPARLPNKVPVKAEGEPEKTPAQKPLKLPPASVSVYTRVEPFTRNCVVGVPVSSAHQQLQKLA
jgi:hypothetical protein